MYTLPQIYALILSKIVKKEDKLGNPTVDNQILSSKMDGTRSWVDPPVADHNALTGIQGGLDVAGIDSDERYHLKKAQWDAVEAATTASGTNRFATISDVGSGGGGGGSATEGLNIMETTW